MNRERKKERKKLEKTAEEKPYEEIVEEMYKMFKSDNGFWEHSLTGGGEMECVMNMIDYHNSSIDEKNLLLEMVSITNDQREWVDIYEAGMINFGNHDGYLEYLNGLDKQEMKRDMEIFQEELSLGCALSIPHGDRPEITTCVGEFDKKDTAIIPVKIDKKGCDYYTGSSPLGKVYIPKHVAIYVRDMVEGRWYRTPEKRVTGADDRWNEEIHMNVKVMGPHCKLPLRCNRVV
jgi:hypothetical protein